VIILLWCAIAVSALICLASACVLWCWPKRFISESGALPGALRNTLPPRHLLNCTGRLLHDLFYVAAVLMVLLVLAVSSIAPDG
jgi:MFS superfamily sulfate permease-like transporter